MAGIGATALQFGCLTMAMPPGNAVIEAWAKDFFEKDLLTLSHDVNVRPALGFDRDAERIRVERVNSFSHLIKASDDDINWLYGLEPGSNVDEIAWGWIGDSAKIVFVTRGGDGASIYRRNKTKLDVSARKVRVQDSVGAGDTFCANTLAQLQKLGALGSGAFERLAALTDKQLIDLAKVSSVAASMACEKTGAEPPTDSELADFLVLLA
jgi:fructokinase